MAGDIAFRRMKPAGVTLPTTKPLLAELAGNRLMPEDVATQSSPVSRGLAEMHAPQLIEQSGLHGLSMPSPLRAKDLGHARHVKLSCGESDKVEADIHCVILAKE